MVRLVYKYRNKHLKILLKLFHNLRLFDVKPMSCQSSARFPINLSILLLYHSKYVQIPLQSHIIPFILAKGIFQLQ